MSELQKIAQDIVPDLRLRIDNWLRSEMRPGSREYLALNQELFENKIGILRVLEHVMVADARAMPLQQDTKS